MVFTCFHQFDFKTKLYIYIYLYLYLYIILSGFVCQVTCGSLPTLRCFPTVWNANDSTQEMDATCMEPPRFTKAQVPTAAPSLGPTSNQMAAMRDDSEKAVRGPGDTTAVWFKRPMVVDRY